ncbi:LacI family DNA-binding transcriptional regulator [Acidisoma sp. 7E03]
MRRRPPKLATMQDVAARAGVSTSTVSHVINGTRRVPAATRAQVLNAISATGYTPNSLARSLKRSETRTIGIAIGDISNPHFTSIVEAAEAAARAEGYSVVLVGISEDPEREREGIDILINRRVDGLMIAPSAGGGAETLARLSAQQIAVVQIDRLADPACDAVVVDNLEGARLLTRHLASLGHRRIGMVTGLPGLSSTAERIEGYRRGLTESGIAFEPALLACGEYNAEPARAATHRLFALPAAPTAVFASNNLMTLGALRALGELGLAVPEDVALVSFDDFAWTDLFKPHLTTIAQPCPAIGENAVRLLLERLANPDLPPRLLQLPVVFKRRSSCGCEAGLKEPTLAIERRA